jgi:hypothetical protein
VVLLQCATCGCGPEAWFSDDDALGFCGWPWFSGNKFSIRLGDGFGVTGDEVLLAFVAMLQCAPSSSGSEAWVSDDAALGFCDGLRITGKEFFGFSLLPVHKSATRSRGSEAWRTVGDASKG